MKHLCALVLLLTASLQAQVQVEALPEPGIQPQVVLTGSGLVHVVYLKGDPKGCDIRHATRKAAGGAWSAPVTVNSVPRSAIAAGTIRGAQIALGKDDSLQVIWNGSTSGKGAKAGQAPLLHARLLPGAREFTPQQDLLGETTALDGGASIAANDKGHVAVVWQRDRLRLGKGRPPALGTAGRPGKERGLQRWRKTSRLELRRRLRPA